MHAIELTAGSLDSFRTTTLPDPRPGPGEVLIRLKAASLNFLDLAVASGHLPTTFPLIPVADGAGEIVTVGTGVTGFSPGDRVMPHFMPLWQGGPLTPQMAKAQRGVSLPGSLADFVVMPERSLVRVPKHLSFEQAATLPVVATTAWRALRAAAIGPNSTVVLLGTGGVSLLALQLAKASGAKVTLVSTSDDKLERAKRLGADSLINARRSPEWARQVVEQSDGFGADLVIETVGPATFAQSLAAVRTGGTVFTIGFLSGAQVQANLFDIIVKQVRVQGNNTGPVCDFAEAVSAIAAHTIAPTISHTFQQGQVAEAYQTMAQGQHFGKIVLTSREH